MIKSIQEYIDYKPYFLKYNVKGYGLFPKVIYYETSFFCNEQKIIHKNLKQVFSCKYCITEEMIDEFGKQKFEELKNSL